MALVKAKERGQWKQKTGSEEAPLCAQAEKNQINLRGLQQGIAPSHIAIG